MKEDSDDDNNTKTFDFVIVRKKSEVTIGIKGHKKEESEKSVREEKEKGVKRNGGFMRTKGKNQTNKCLKRAEIKAGVSTHKK